MAQRPPVRPTREQIVRGRIRAWNAVHPPAQDIDEDATVRVSSTEGLSGRIGDSGHAFGDFQLNDAGGVLTGKFPGWSAQQKQAWASSPAGIDFALGGISKVAGGLKGRRAVENIVRRYERPADPGGEIARALAGSGGGGTGAMTSTIPGPSPAPAAAPMPGRPMNPLLAIIQSTRRGLGYQPSGQDPLAQMLAQRPVSPPQVNAQPLPYTPGTPPSFQTLPATPAQGQGQLAELLHEGVGGPTHSTGEHIHWATRNPQVALALLAEAKRRGLTTLENPYVDPVNASVHAPHSFHKQVFPGLYDGRQLGEAGDVSGPGMSAYEQWVRSKYGGRRAPRR